MIKKAKTIRIDEDLIKYIESYFENFSAGALQLMRDGITYRNSLSVNQNDQMLIRQIIKDVVKNEVEINENRQAKILEKVALETTAIYLLLQSIYISNNEEGIDEEEFKKEMNQLIIKSSDIISNLAEIDDIVNSRVHDLLGI